MPCLFGENRGLDLCEIIGSVTLQGVPRKIVPRLMTMGPFYPCGSNIIKSKSTGKQETHRHKSRLCPDCVSAVEELYAMLSRS